MCGIVGVVSKEKAVNPFWLSFYALFIYVL